MSQEDIDSEDGIWQYKSVVKRKKTHTLSPAVETVTKRRCNSRQTSRRDSLASIKRPKRTTSVTHGKKNREPEINGHGKSVANGLFYSESPSSSQETNNSYAAGAPCSGDYCPLCQMPFSALLVHSQKWHVAECLDRPRDTCTECPDGLRCSSTVPNHYRNYNHTFLAKSRANGDTALLSLYQQPETTGESSSSCLPGLVNTNNSKTSDSQMSQDSTDSFEVSSPCNNITNTPLSKPKNGLLFLRSPGPEDLRKKKGWSSTPTRRKSLVSSQESNNEQSSTPVEDNRKGQTGESNSKTLPENYDDFISYSPLSDLPAQTEVQSTQCRKELFKNSSQGVEDECSMSQVTYDFSSEDELLNEFMDSLDASNSSEENQLDSLTSFAPTDQLAASQIQPDLSLAACAATTCTINNPSPQSIVLENLRERLHNSNSLHLQNSSDINQLGLLHPNSQVPPSPNQTNHKSSTMPPQKGKSGAVQASSLKQTDIGVFFGLKPLNKKQEEAEKRPQEPSTISTVVLKNKEPMQPRRGEKGRKSRKDTSADTSEGTAKAERSDSVNANGGTKGGYPRRWGRRSRVNADGEVQFPRCPFYKKIPGTKFAIDAFQYGEIEGITAYFLTHFHSDHYGGLTKKSTFPIYCNRITGNLVKNKLKVLEQYVHILPMNTQVSVEGVKVTLLEANHCPGAAMLLFFLPDGQRVLHTGDFRADPSMETYPELLSCRVQTLYLDTTYCNPEYAFPKQQEVVNFAANTAFESVTLNPRTLVVCGSYSVGKEKVFLALAEVLGSKVCLSRDKYNTMCCLESDVVKRCITTDWKAAQVHVLPMMQLSFNKLQQHLARFSTQYDRLVAFKPTGWTFSQQVETVENIQPMVSGNISIYGVPYSEHSSFLELKRFVQWLQPLKIIPTVNNGSWANRKTMETYFRDWLAEAKANT